MQFSPYDWLLHIKSTVSGQLGVMKDADLPLSAADLDGATQDGQALVFDANAEAAQFAFTLPREFDAESDELRFQLGVEHVSGTSIDLAVSSVDRWRAGEGEGSVTLDLPDAVTINAAFDSGVIEVDLSNGSWQAGDVVLVTVAASDLVTAGVAHARSAQLSFRSFLVAHDRDQR